MNDKNLDVWDTATSLHDESERGIQNSDPWKDAMSLHEDAESRTEKFTPQELSDAYKMASTKEEYENLKDYIAKHYGETSDTQSEDSSQNHGQNHPMGRTFNQDEDLDEKGKVKTKSMSFR